VTIPRWLLIAAVAVATRVNGNLGPPASPSRQSASAPVEILYDGATIERTAAKGDSHRFDVSLSEGDFFEISVSQAQVYVTLSVEGPDGAVLHSLNVPDIDPLPQPLMLVAPASGRYSIGVSVGGNPYIALHKDNRTDVVRKYSLRVLALRPATAGDRERTRWFAMLKRAVEEERRESMDGLRNAVPLYQETAVGWRSMGDTRMEAVTLEALAQLTGYFTQYGSESIAARERLAELYSTMDDRELEVRNLNRLATECWEAGRLDRAKEIATRELGLASAHGVHWGVAASLRQLGVAEFHLGNYDAARDFALRAQERAAAIAERPLESLALYDLSRLDSLAGDYDAAIAHDTRALELAADNDPAASLAMMWLGFTYLSRGELDAAATRFQARLDLARRYVQRDQEAFTRLGLADVKLARGDRAAARAGYEAAAQALERGAQLWRCIAEQRVGRMDLEDGQLDKAVGRFETMRRIAAAWHNPECEAEARAGLADVASRRGALEIADAEAHSVVDLTEAFRHAGVNIESRALGFGALAPAYERAIAISMQRAERGDSDAVSRALTLNEQALARGLLDKVAESRLESRARVPPGLAEELRRVRERWRARLAELQVAMRLHPDAAATVALVDETHELEVRVRDLEAKIDAADPRHATFVRPRPLSVAAIQALLDDDTVLLEYALGDAHSYLWVVSRGDSQAFTLSPRAEIETLARRVHEQYARPPGAPGQLAAADRAAVADRQALARLIIEPAASLLQPKRLVLVLPGALSLVPFPALPADGDSPMVARHEIVQIPSATTLGAMRALTAGRPRAPRTAAVFADPIFDAKDPRVLGTSSPVQRDPASPAPRVGGLSMTRLPFSRTEAQEIAALDPRSVSVFLGFEATREHAVGTALSEYRFIHFATHGVVNQTLPSLSSVVLSLVDRAGHPRDGFVMLPDVYDMTLNADVVVLSGCQTALGKDVRGEGPIGLARAFMYAGVPRVVASLWQVDDLATAELMKRFYRGVLVDGLTPASALRAAQQQLAATRRWRSPYFWAPFVLQGDWR
jgi:CHAT domain-containing protein